MGFPIGSKVRKTFLTQNEQKRFGSEKKGQYQTNSNKMFKKTEGAAILPKQRTKQREGTRNGRGMMTSILIHKNEKR